MTWRSTWLRKGLTTIGPLGSQTRKLLIWLTTFWTINTIKKLISVVKKISSSCIQTKAYVVTTLFNTTGLLVSVNLIHSHIIYLLWGKILQLTKANIRTSLRSTPYSNQYLLILLDNTNMYFWVIPSGIDIVIVHIAHVMFD